MKRDERLARFRRPKGARPLVLGHRGARANAPENTRAAFDRALSEGAEGVELDVRMTSDGQLVIAHDPSLSLAGRTDRVSIESLSGSQIARARLASGEPIPTLAEILAWQKETGALVNVELKGDVKAPLWMARRAVEMIREHGGDGLLLSSFHPGQVRLLARRLADVPTALLVENGDFWRVFGASYRALGAIGVHPGKALVTAERVRLWQNEHALVNVWTVNEPDDAVRLAALGVDAIITDAPARILAALASA